MARAEGQGARPRHQGDRLLITRAIRSPIAPQDMGGVASLSPGPHAGAADWGWRDAEPPTARLPSLQRGDGATQVWPHGTG